MAQSSPKGQAKPVAAKSTKQQPAAKPATRAKKGK